MTEIVHRAFWDSLQEQLNSDPPNYNHAVILLQEVKTVSVYGNKSEALVAEQEGLLRLPFILICLEDQNKSVYSMYKRHRNINTWPEMGKVCHVGLH